MVTNEENKTRMRAIYTAVCFEGPVCLTLTTYRIVNIHGAEMYLGEECGGLSDMHLY